MKLSDVVRFENQIWLVRRYDPKRTRTAILIDWEGRLRSIRFDAPEVEVIANPTKEWPFITVRDNPKGVRITHITRIVNHLLVSLNRMIDWVPSDPVRPGGSIFLNPSLGFKPSDTLLLHWEKGSPTSVRIPSGFATMEVKVARADAAKQKVEALTAYDKLLQDDGFGEDE